MNNTLDSWLGFLDAYENVIEKIIEFCYTPKTIREIVQEFNYVEDVIRFVFRKLVDQGALEITEQDHDGRDMYRATKAPSHILKGVSSNEITERRRMWNKIVFLGENGVGKTSLILRFVDKCNLLDDATARSAGAQIHQKFIVHKDQRYFVVIWEPVGNRSWVQATRVQWGNAGGAFFVFDTTDSKTLESIDFWLDLISSSGEKVPLVIVENKIDLGSQIPEGLVDSYVRKYGADHIRTSAKDDDTLEEVFKRMVMDNLVKEINMKQKQDSGSI